MSAGRVRSSWPFGPSTLTWPGARVTFTDFGTWTGSFPIRDNSFYLLPDERQDFAAEAFACRLPSAHDPLSSAEDRDAEAAEHPQAGPADPLHTRDDPGAVRPRLEDDTHRLRGAVRLDVVAGDVTLVLQDACDLELQARGRNLDLSMPRGIGVADPRQHVGDGV